MLVFFTYPLVVKFFYLRRLETSPYQAFLTWSYTFSTKGYQEMNQEVQELAEVHGRQ